MTKRLFLMAASLLVAEASLFAEEDAMARTIAALEAAGYSPADHADDIARLWQRPSATTEAVARSVALVHDEVRQLIDDAENSSSDQAHPQELKTPIADPFLAANVDLFLAQSLVRQHRLDEALILIEKLAIDQLLEPSSAHLMSASCHFHLGDAAAAQASLDRLEELDDVPARHAALAIALRSAVERTDPASLVGIARDMRDVRRRLDLEQSDEPVQTREDAILARLDKMIKELEQQQNKTAPGSANDPQSSAPAQDSRLADMKAAGQTDRQALRDRSAWGNLPPKERERALQEIGRDLPGPYRNAVEQYFRKLSQNPGRSAP
jgi:hypothetical protein